MSRHFLDRHSVDQYMRTHPCNILSSPFITNLSAISAMIALAVDFPDPYAYSYMS